MKINPYPRLMSSLTSTSFSGKKDGSILPLSGSLGGGRGGGGVNSGGSSSSFDSSFQDSWRNEAKNIYKDEHLATMSLWFL